MSDYLDGEWIPSDWDLDGQLGIMDMYIGVIAQWVADANALAAELKTRESYSYVDHGYEGPYGGTYAVEHPGGIIRYEDTQIDDFDIEPVFDYSYIVDNYYPTSELSILDVIPSPSFSELVELEEAFLNAFHYGITGLSESDDSYRLLKEWGDTESDPSDVAHTVADYITDYVSEIKSDIIPYLQQMKSKWEQLVQEDAQERYDLYVTNNQKSSGVYESVQAMEAVHSFASDAVCMLNESTPEKASGDIDELEEDLRAFIKMVEGSGSSVLKQSDVAKMVAVLDDINNIAKFAYNSSDIRSWEFKNTQKQDAILAFDNLRFYAEKRIGEMEENHSLRKAASKAREMPSYRYLTGTTVKVLPKNRYGKVVGMRLEGGTGKQLYEVKIDGVGREYYPTRQLRKVE